MIAVIFGIFWFYCLLGLSLVVSFWVIGKFTQKDEFMFIKKVLKGLFVVLVSPISLLVCLIALVNYKTPHCPDDDV